MFTTMTEAGMEAEQHIQMTKLTCWNLCSSLNDIILDKFLLLPWQLTSRGELLCFTRPNISTTLLDKTVNEWLAHWKWKQCNTALVNMDFLGLCLQWVKAEEPGTSSLFFMFKEWLWKVWYRICVQYECVFVKWRCWKLLLETLLI